MTAGSVDQNANAVAVAGASANGVRRIRVPPRSSFYAEQSRRRRATWRLSFVCVVITALLGLVLSTILSPLLLAIAVGTLKAAGHLGCPPSLCAAATQEVDRWVHQQIGIFLSVLDNWPRAATRSQKLVLVGDFAAGCTLLLPGIAAMMLAWAALRAVQVKAGMLDLIATLGARPIRPNDTQEHRLANIVEEISLAAGIPTPRLMLIDTSVANAVAVGRSYDTAVVIVTRGLLEGLDRDQTEAVVAHVVASIVNGDLIVMQSLVALFQSFGLFHTFLDLPLRLAAWSALGRFCRAFTDPSLSPLSRLLALQGIEDSLEIDEAFTPMMILLLPLNLVMMFQKFVLFLWTTFIVGWPLALLWRARRYLADASAVALTRNPEALASALRQLAPSADIPAGGERRAYLFLCGPNRAGGRSGNLHDISAMHVSPLALHPPLDSRLRRLVALGSSAAYLPAAWLRPWPQVAKSMNARNVLKLIAALPLILLVIAILLLGLLAAMGLLGAIIFLTQLTTMLSFMLGFALLALVLRL